MTDSFVEALTVPRGPVDLAAYDTGVTPGFSGSKKKGKAALYALGDELSDLQERLFAQGQTGGDRRILLVLQGMDTSGKGGILRHAVGLVDPQGVHIKSFKAPTKAERRHDFLWRIEKELPRPGIIGVFDRSHYEDVLIGRVRELAAPEEIERRYDAINDLEKRLTDEGTTIVKCMLHISSDEQKSRLLARLDDATKLWKYNPADVDERQLWPAYRRAYEVALERTNTEHAPWLVVPGDRKWYGKLAVAQVLLETLRRMNLAWPPADVGIAEEKRRLTDETLPPS
jgi:PPK2 family polyphosphate:nucleotide phosphotransferase